MVNDTYEFRVLTRQLNSDPNLHFLLREHDLESALQQPQSHEVEMAFKKCALYAQRAIIVTKPKTLYIAEGDNPEAKTQWSGGQVSQRLKEFYERYNNLPNFKETFYYLPERIQESVEEWDYDEFSVRENEPFVFSESYTNKFGVDMSLSDPHINHHIFEPLNCVSDDLSVWNVWLPELKNVPFDVLLKIRRDEGDAFARFQFTLKKLIAESDKLDSALRTKELFQKVDYEVRTFEAKMNQIKNNRAVKAYESVVGFSIMGLCFAMPSEIAQLVSSVIGMYSGKDFISSLFREKEQINSFKVSDFYTPWLCTRLAKKNKRLG